MLNELQIQSSTTRASMSGLIGYYTQTFRTRSFRAEPFRTLVRGVYYELLRRLGATANVTCWFGPHRFRWQTKALPARFGAGGFFVQRQYYEPLMEFGHRFIRPGDVVIDGGANQGIFTCAFAAAVGASGKVYAFEPLDYAFRTASKNVEMNDFHNCTIINKALSDGGGSPSSMRVSGR